jgi:hypothetical protein
MTDTPLKWRSVERLLLLRIPLKMTGVSGGR